MHIDEFILDMTVNVYLVVALTVVYFCDIDLAVNQLNWLLH